MLSVIHSILPDKDGVILDDLLLHRIGAAAIGGQGQRIGGGGIGVGVIAVVAAVALEALVPLDVSHVQAPVKAKDVITSHRQIESPKCNENALKAMHLF